MAERQYSEVTLNGQTLKVYHGFPMAAVRAMTEAGQQPKLMPEQHALLAALKQDDPVPPECADYLSQLTLYQGRFVQSYFLLPPALMDTIDAREIAAVFGKIMEVQALDPFVPCPQPEAAKTEPPTTGS